MEQSSGHVDSVSNGDDSESQQQQAKDGKTNMKDTSTQGSIDRLEKFATPTIQKSNKEEHSVMKMKSRYY